MTEAFDTSEKSSEWTAVGETQSGEDRSMYCPNLRHGHVYKFRVRAVNRLGKSDPGLLPGDGILIKDPWGEYVFIVFFQFMHRYIYITPTVLKTGIYTTAGHCTCEDVKVRVDPFFRDLDQFTILLPVKDLSSVHNPYFLAMNNMIAIRSQSFFFKAEN